MTTTKCKSCKDVETTEQSYSEYIPCLYERPFLIGTKAKNKMGYENRWKNRIMISIILYFSIIALFYNGISILDAYISNAQPYKYAALVLASIIFWPIIIIYDSELFYRTCEKLYCLLTPSAKTLNWYEKSARRYFCLFSKNEKNAFGAIVINAMCSTLIIVLYVLKVYAPNFIPKILNTPWPIVVCVAICSLTFFCKSLIEISLFLCSLFVVDWLTTHTFQNTHHTN